MDDKSCGNCSIKTTLSINRILIPIIVMLVLDMFLKTATLSPNVNIQVPFKDTDRGDGKGNGDMSSGYRF